MQRCSELRDRDSNPNFRNQNPASYPLDDPARDAADRSNPALEGGLRVEPVHRDEPFLVFGVDVRDHLDVRLKTRAMQLRLQQAVDLEEP